MKIIIKLSGLFLTVILLIYGCSKFNDKDLIYINPDLPIILNSIDSTSDNSCTITSKIDNSGKPKILYQGVCWDTLPNPVFDSSNHKKDTTTKSPFTTILTGLKPRTLYYARAYAVNSAGVAYGDQVTFITPAKSPFNIGQFYAGGFIFYIDSTGNHGLVCDTTDLTYYTDSTHLSDSIQWRIVAGIDYSGANATAIGSGASNTRKIMATYGNVKNAASLCVNYNGEGYNDWFLPSKDELNQIYVNLTAKGLGNMSTTNYWSSSSNIVKGISYAWSQYFSNGNQYYFNGYFYLNIRAARAF